MNLRIVRNISLLVALLGLLLIYLFSPSQEHISKTITEIRKDCSGLVNLAGTVREISYSSNGNLIAALYQNKSKIMIFLRDDSVQEGDNISIFGKANKFSNQCWIFPERVELR